MDDQRPLTNRQREILVLYAQGLHLRQIALALGIAKNTVDVHRAGILANLGVRSLVQAAVMGIARGEIVLDGEAVVEGGRPSAAEAPSKSGDLALAA